MSLRIAALVKQIPAFDEMTLGADGRLVREGLDLEMNPYCRRAVAEAVHLAAEHGGEVVVLTLGPSTADDTLREAIAWGIERGVSIRGVLVSDQAFAGSDTLATAKALARALEREGEFDLVLTGRNSVDADTGQVGPELAELLDLPFATGVRHLSVSDRIADVRCEHDDGWMQARVALPAVLSTAERLIDPCKVDPEGRAAVDPELITLVTAADLGHGRWGTAASPTSVGPVRVIESARLRLTDPDDPIDVQVARAVDLLIERSALDDAGDGPGMDGVVPASRVDATRTIAVLVEPSRAALTRELLGAAAQIDGARVTGFVTGDADPRELGSWGADEVVAADGALVEEDIARAVVGWATVAEPWAIIAPSTAWGREVASRAAAALEAGLTGDAIDLELDGDRLLAWKPAFGGQLIAAISAASPIQMATVRPGMLPHFAPRTHTAAVTAQDWSTRGRVEILARTRDDDIDVLAEASAVIGVGQAVPPDEYPALQPLAEALGAELAATRKVTDKGWMPRSRQVGITGRSITPRIYVSIGASGKFNHMIGVRAAETVIAVNSAPDALVFQGADVGIVADWRAALPLLVEAIEKARAGSAG
jgi:electron transfer flavoprotein alpha subunit